MPPVDRRFRRVVRIGNGVGRSPGCDFHPLTISAGDIAVQRHHQGEQRIATLPAVTYPLPRRAELCGCMTACR